MTECSIFVKLLSGDLLTIPILSTDILTINFIIDGIQYNYEEYKSIHPNKFYIFPLEHDEKDICLEHWIPEPDETVGLLIHHDEPDISIIYSGRYNGDNEASWIKWEVIIKSSRHSEDEICRFHFFSEVIKNNENLPLLFHENCVKNGCPLNCEENSTSNYISVKTEEDYIQNNEIIPINGSVHNTDEWIWNISLPGVFEDISDLIIHYNSGVPFHLKYVVINPLEEEWKSAQKWLEEEEYYYNTHYDNQSDYDD